MNNSIIAWKARAQLDDFMVKMFHGFSKPKNKFIRDMVYGIQATGDTILTDIARCVDSENRHRNVENRLSRNLQADTRPGESPASFRAASSSVLPSPVRW